ncbi:metal-dependent hydrolase [Halobacteriales archaeon QH_10_65_19]|nr:MAG: metal-dependent hydrolase [Halobacteriales archaeon QH_10_65_19]
MGGRMEESRMWPWGHLAVAYLLSTGYVRARFDRPIRGGPVLWLALDSQLPDLVDKPLAWYVRTLPTGRSLAHSLLVVVPLAVLAYVLARRVGRRESGAVFGIGVLSHVLSDALPALWNPDATASFLLWPALPVTPYEGGPPTILELQPRPARRPGRRPAGTRPRRPGRQPGTTARAARG